MNKKIFLAICAISIFALCGCGKKEQDQDLLQQIKLRDRLVVGVKSDSKPFGYIDEKGKNAGFDIDLAKEIAKNILGSEDKVEFKTVSASNRIMALNSSDVDMVIATMTITPQRLAVVDFSVPYYTTGQTFLIDKESKISSISQLQGKKVIVVYGSTSEKNLRHIAPDIQIVGFKSYESAYKGLKEGMADAIFADYAILLNFAQNDKSLKLLNQKYSNEPYAVAFKKGIVSNSLRNEVNSIIKGMQSSGIMDKISSKWINK